MDPMLPAVSRIISERTRQQIVEGYAPEHDDEHKNGELADAAACYATCNAGGLDTRADVVASVWPWSEGPKFSGDTIDGRLRELEKAGALILAEMDRLERRKLAIEQERSRQRMRWEAEAEKARDAGQPEPEAPTFGPIPWRP